MKDLLLFSFIRLQEAICRQKEYRKYYQECLFLVITKRYKKKYGGLFPLSGKNFISVNLNLLASQCKPSFAAESKEKWLTVVNISLICYAKESVQLALMS